MKCALKLLALLAALISLFQVIGCGKTFTYDDLGRLTSVNMPGESGKTPGCQAPFVATMADGRMIAMAVPIRSHSDKGPVFKLQLTFPVSMGPRGERQSSIWSHAYESHIRKEGDNLKVVLRAGIGPTFVLEGSNFVVQPTPDCACSYNIERSGSAIMVRKNSSADESLSSPYDAWEVGDTWVFEPVTDSKFQLTKIVDSKGQAMTFIYAKGRLERVRMAGGGMVEFTYDEADHLVSVKTPEERIAKLCYQNGLMTSFNDSGGRLYELSYDHDGRLVTILRADAVGTKTSIVYEEIGGVTKVRVVRSSGLSL